MKSSFFPKSDAERINANYCRMYIKGMLLNRFPVSDLTKAAEKRSGQMKYYNNRDSEELDYLADEIYLAMDERLRNVMLKLEMRLFMPINSIDIENVDMQYFNEYFEPLFYKIVDIEPVPAITKEHKKKWEKQHFK